MGAYARAGVDRRAGDALVGDIARLGAGLERALGAAVRRRIKSRVGGYASLYELSKDRWLAASTDGVGTKLKLAFESGQHRTVGIDLVAMSINDLLCVGAKPLFFLDYFATGRLERSTARAVIAGIVEGCRQAQVALVGGETAEMPGFYQSGEYDLAGFAVGELAPKQALPKPKIGAGYVLIGVASSGFHSNGYSLLRRWLEREPAGRARSRRRTQLLQPTRIYVRSVAPLLARGWIAGAAHITGSGFLNVPRISTAVDYEISLPRLRERAPVIAWTESQGVPWAELVQTFNMGVGLVLAVESRHAERVLLGLKRSGERAWRLGQTRPRSSQRHVIVKLTEQGTDRSARLIY